MVVTSGGKVTTLRADREVLALHEQFYNNNNKILLKYLNYLYTYGVVWYGMVFFGGVFS